MTHDTAFCRSSGVTVCWNLIAFTRMWCEVSH